MGPNHNPRHQVDLIQQVLQQDKKPVAFFLGAGCPMGIPDPLDKGKPLIPHIGGLTEQALGAIADSGLQNELETLNQYFKEINVDAPNVEDFLTHIRSLRQVCGTSGARGLSADELAQLEFSIIDCIYLAALKSLSDIDTPYHKIAAWIGATRRSSPVEIFTTNYDLLMEQAMEESRVPYFDGFVGSRMTFFDPYAMEDDILPSRWARLWKLHGSINWRIDNGVVSRGEDTRDAKGRLIHPTHLKYDESRRMPYLAMFDRLRAFLREPSAALVICGFSFSDEHLNEAIADGLRGNPTAAAWGLMFGALDEYPKAARLASSCGNLSILAREAAVIGTKNAAWSTKRKDDPEMMESVLGIEWPGKDAAADGDEIKPEFTLGNFAELGQFIEHLMGPNDRKQGERAE